MGYCQPIPRHTPELGVGLVVLGLAGPAVNTALAAPSAPSPALPLSYALLTPPPRPPTPACPPPPARRLVGPEALSAGGGGMQRRCWDGTAV